MTSRTRSGREAALRASDPLGSPEARSVPELITENALRTSTDPGGHAGTGTSRTVLAPPRSCSTCFTRSPYSPRTTQQRTDDLVQRLALDPVLVPEREVEHRPQVEAHRAAQRPGGHRALDRGRIEVALHRGLAQHALQQRPDLVVEPLLDRRREALLGPVDHPVGHDVGD